MLTLHGCNPQCFDLFMHILTHYCIHSVSSYFAYKCILVDLLKKTRTKCTLVFRLVPRPIGIVRFFEWAWVRGYLVLYAFNC